MTIKSMKKTRELTFIWQNILTKRLIMIMFGKQNNKLTMKKILLIFFSALLFGCVDGPEILDCFVIPPLNDTTVCIEIYEPVCGCNDVTYDNECYAEKSGVSFWIEGECLD